MQQISALARSIDGCAPREGANQTAIEGLWLYQGHCDVPRQPVVYRPSICVVAQGSKRVFLGEKTYSYDPNNYLISTLTVPIEAEVYNVAPGHPYLGLSLEVDSAMVSQLMLEMDLFQDGRPATGGAELLSSTPITEPLQRSLTRLVELTGQSMDRAILSEGVKREIFYEVLKGPQGGALRNCVRNHGGANRIAPVIHYIEENFEHPLDIDTLAGIAQMSTSSLHEQFRAFTSLSPMQFVKNLRLHRARSLLISGTKASMASYAVGYSSPSQFSREFKRLFGHSPSEVQALAD